ncbi:glycosyltransferase family A protein [Brevundimonas faecalis]|uniref:glycosyltransferase family A protein n=1 Tax=Brevundimonas faecalis TaxID=947378 RepID=UPI0036134607
MTQFPLSAHNVAFQGGRSLALPAEVTVIVTLYNYTSVIQEALDSVAEQTMSSIDLVVVEDRSSDSSFDTALAWMKKNHLRFESCKLIQNDWNYGLATSRNIALGHVLSEYVMVLDADNTLLPTAVERLLRAVEVSGDAAAYSQLELFGEVSAVGDAGAWDPERLGRGNYIDAMALFRTLAIRQCGGYDLFEVAGWEDYDLWCKFHEQGLVATFVPQILCRYRVHGSSMLRAETNAEIATVTSEMVRRHPWLKLPVQVGGAS